MIPCISHVISERFGGYVVATKRCTYPYLLYLLPVEIGYEMTNAVVFVYIDMVAMPVYPSEGTEHWGLVTYRQSWLLYDPRQVNDFHKQRIINIMAHELAHNVHLLSVNFK